MSTPSIEDVLAEHEEGQGWQEDADGNLVYDCTCGATSPALVLSDACITEGDAEAAAAWHRAHLADAIRAHLAEHTDEAAGAVERVRGLADKWDEARRPGMVGISTAIRAALAGGASGAAEEADE